MDYTSPPLVHQKRRIENNFRIQWLRHISITLHLPARNNSAYTTSRDFFLGPIQDRQRGRDIAIFVAVEHPTPGPPADQFINDEQDLMLKPFWDCYMSSALKKHVTVRFGEEVLNRGIRGGHIVNNTELPELEVSESGTEISFHWKAALQELMQEDMYMRRFTVKRVG